MICRKNITVRKTWIDDNNAQRKRPDSVEIILLRDGKNYNTAEVTADDNWVHTFKCLPVWNGSQKYKYTVDEAVPDGYAKSIDGYNVTNTITETTVSGVKTWVDNHNAAKARPEKITVILYQNGTRLRTLDLASPPDNQDTAAFSFTGLPLADNEGRPFVYTIDEAAVIGYIMAVRGFNITNTIHGRFSFIKTSVATDLGLQGAIFEIRQNGALIASSESDAEGNVSFSNLLSGAYLMAETTPPAGYMSDTAVYSVVVDADGGVTIDGMPAAEFSIKNSPEILVRRATSVLPAYMAAPNTWPLHGTGMSDLYMTDKIVITTEVAPVTVKWDYGVKDVAYFAAGGGYDITASYKSGIPASTNGDYTVYLLFAGGYEVAITITIDNVRDGSKAMPYLLIDYTTADALEPSVEGISQYILDFMQGDNSKLTKNYELYENIDMTGKIWAPLGDGTQFGFTGTFYGNDNDIKNMSVTTSGGSVYNTGMFAGVSNGAVIEGVGLIDCTIVNTNWDAAGFAGLVAATDGGATILKDLRFSGSVASNATGAGIVSAISAMNGNVVIDGCTVDGVVTGVSSGGIAGHASIPTSGTVAIINCNTTGSCYSTGTSILNYAGGILGACSDTGNGLLRIQNCVNAMSVQSNAKAGGIVGTGTSAFASLISSCLNIGKITGVNQVGGIAGGFTDTSATNMMRIENCYNTAEITAAVVSTGYVGGIIGIGYSYVGVKNSYNTGDVVASTSSIQNIVGGISGNYGLIENCAAINALCSNRRNSIARISENTTSAAQSVLNNNVAFDNMQVLINGIQKSPLDTGSSGTDGIDVSKPEIKNELLYRDTLGWDFNNIWSFGNEGYTLPVLREVPATLQPTVLPPHLI